MGEHRTFREQKDSIDLLNECEGEENTQPYIISN
jgi:hypothetical protein